MLWGGYFISIISLPTPRGMDSDSSFSSCFPSSSFSSSSSSMMGVVVVFSPFSSSSSIIGVVVVTHEETEEEKEDEKAISIGSVSLLTPSMECSRI